MVTLEPEKGSNMTEKTYIAYCHGEVVGKYECLENAVESSLAACLCASGKSDGPRFPIPAVEITDSKGETLELMTGINVSNLLPGSKGGR